MVLLMLDADTVTSYKRRGKRVYQNKVDFLRALERSEEHIQDSDLAECVYKAKNLLTNSITAMEE